MKRVLATLFVCLMAIGLMGCEKTTPVDQGGSDSDSVQEQDPVTELPLFEIDKQDSFSRMTYSVASKWKKDIAKDNAINYLYPENGFELRVVKYNRAVDYSDQKRLDGFFDMCESELENSGYTITESERLLIDNRPSLNLLCVKKGSTFSVYYIATEAGQYSLAFNGSDETYKDVEGEIINSISFKRDFISDDASVKDYRSFYKSKDLTSALEVLERYLEKSPADPVAARLLDLTMTYDELIGNCEVVTDDVDKTERLYYSGVISISNEINIVPFYEYKQGSFSTSSMNLIVGFQKNDWLFFEKAKIVFDGTEEYWYSSWKGYNMNRDVLGGYFIEETSPVVNVLDKDTELFRNYPATILRFIADNDENYDHSIAGVEKNALLTLSKMESVQKEIFNLLSGQQDL